MKKFILVATFVLILASIGSTEIVNPNTQHCSCSMMMSEADCLTVSGCTWTPAVAVTSTSIAIAGSCEFLEFIPLPIAISYCPQIVQPVANCWQTHGCAYFNSLCTHFTGCSAYVKTTNFDCQAISLLCITDGTQCTDAKSCNKYTEETQCTENPSISGIKKCKWKNNACQDYACTEANINLTTDAACNSWLQGCVSTGKGCTLTLEACTSYAGDNVTCSGLKGTDGNCEGITSGSNCTARICNKAASNLVTDSKCISYQGGCITNGKGCVTSPLSACSTYLGDNITCVGYIGSDGICEGDSGATICRSRICTNAPTSNNTDTLCNAFKTGCVTTGKGCITIKSTCSSYSGTTITCIEYIGTDGQCQGTNLLLSSPCAAKICQDAPTTTSTDAGCIQYQLGCKSTGKGCLPSLGLCSSYFGTTITCEGYIGSDGKCKGTYIDIDSSCATKLCTEAPISATTNEACALYQFRCVTTGSGCVAETECLETIKSLSCIGTDGCGWNSICVASQHCSDFKTISICNDNNAILLSGGTTTTTLCIWSGSVCRDIACTDASSSNNTDQLCDAFVVGCWTNGNGCLTPSAPCSFYFGNRSTCSSFTRKCYNVEGASTTTACTERVCNDDITSTLDSQCNSFKAGCLTKGIGCIDPSKLCSDYNGIQSACQAFRGNNGLTQCWSLSTTVSSACINKTCAHQVSATSNPDCDTFLSGCLYNGVGCVTKSQLCSSYSGTQSQCNMFKANNGVDTCWNTSTTVSGSCIVKNCGHAGALTTDIDCIAFLESCLTTGSQCISKTAACSAYSGTLAQCETFTGNSIKCYNKDVCVERLCTDKISGVADNSECTTYLASCTYYNQGCVTSNICTGYPGNTLVICQDIIDNSSTPRKCWWITGGTTCIYRTCVDAPTVSNQQGCIDYLSSCVFNGSICLDKGLCNSFVAFGVDTPAKQTNCRAMQSITGTYCWNSGGTNCEDIQCSNEATPTSQLSCDNHIVGLDNCKWNGTTCVNTNHCSLFNPTGANDSIKLSTCSALSDISAPSATCYFIIGASNCVSRSCSNVPTPSNQLSCDSHLSGKCGWNGTICVNLGDCTSYIPTGASDSAKITICQALITNDSTPKKCTFLLGGSTCIDRTCDNIVSPLSSTDCYQWIDKCLWNGSICEITQPCSAYSITGAKIGTIIQMCEKPEVSLSVPLYCTQRADLVASSCVVTSCTTIQNPQTQSDCKNFSADCRWSGIGTCLESAACTAYTVAVLTGINQCSVLTDFTGMQCKYITGTACSNAACIDKLNATSKQDCTAQGTNCRYLGVGTCAPSAAACAYTITASDKPTICNNVTDNGNPPLNCNYLPGASACSPRSTCISYTGSSDAICNLMYDTEGRQCKYISGSTCDLHECYEMMDAIKAVDCTNYGAKCRYLGTGICSEQGLCTSYIVNSSNGPSVCNNLKDNNGTPKQCTYVSGITCVDAGTCDSYAGLDNTTGPYLCTHVVNVQQGRCKFALNGFICITAVCADITYASNIQDCAGCRYVGTSTCQAAGACPSYLVYGTDYFKLEICNSLADVYGVLCTWVSAGTCVVRDCANKISPNSNASCIAWKSTCSFTGQICITTAPCAGYLPVGLDNVSRRAHCAAIYDNSTPPVQCSYTDDASICVVRSCVTSGALTSYSACNNWLSSCTFNGTNCVTGVGCNTYTQESLAVAIINFTDQDKCRIYKNNSNAGCLLDIPRCNLRTCANITSYPTSFSDCTSWLSTCRFTGNICVTAQPCNYTLSGDYYQVGRTDEQKIAFCNSLEDNTDSIPKIYCTLTTPIASGTVCIPRTCSNINPTPISQANCYNWLSTCNYNGTTCVAQSTCASYTSTGTDDATRGTECRTLKNAAGDLCGFVTGTNQTNCTDRVCSNAPTPTSDNDCSTYKTNCTISYASTAVCLDNTSDCTLFFGLPAQCQSLTGNSLQCWSIIGASTTVPQACKVKEPSDTSSSPAVNQCAITPCTEKICSENTTSTTDLECDSFIPGCLTKGTGCIDSTEPCSKYQGIQSTCSGYIGNQKKCWNPSSVTIATTYCVDKICSDDNVSTTDTACNQLLEVCITKGTGCIELTASCSQYQGTQAICLVFKGNSQTKLCSNVATASLTTFCVEKACIHNITATSDSDCETFFPRAAGAIIPLCVTNGTGCVDYPRVCSGFTGTSEECGNFTATDGPCKTSATGGISASGTCTPRICSEALNSNNTDALCHAFHPTCVTTGFGCDTSVCASVQEQNSCSAKTGCSWVNNCRSIGEDCSLLTSSLASICANTPVSSGSKKCIWYNGSTCKAQVCGDLPITLTSHISCSSVLSTCTTTGSGCITMASCRAYASEIICKVAQTNIGDTCVWDNNACRAKKCIDAPKGTNTDAKCNAYLTGCKTNGNSCLESITCSTLLTVYTCQVDGNFSPCLFVNGICYNYTKCEDAIMTTHLACQSFSPLCTTNGENCISITTCIKTTNFLSCVVGTDGICGWLPEYGAIVGRCQLFGVCSDARATDNVSCTAYGINCITDGIKCVDNGACSAYQTEIACDQGGKDGICQFISSSSSCRLRECIDATASNNSGGIITHSGCYAFTVKDKCTTNGTSCMAFQTCAQYTVKAGCFEGTDGLCTFTFPVGQTTGTFTCRVKVCEDFTLATSALCSKALTGAGLGTGCVSNGTNCIVKAPCLQYTSKEACNGGGSNGGCVFTPGTTSPNVGTCEVMSACADASNDSFACKANVLACNWQQLKSSTITTNSCSAQTCSSKSQGSTCNPVPSFDLNTYTICGPAINGGCEEVAGMTLSAGTCQYYTMQTFTWDEITSQCLACFAPTQIDLPIQMVNYTTVGDVIKQIAGLVILVIFII